LIEREEQEQGEPAAVTPDAEPAAATPEVEPTAATADAETTEVAPDTEPAEVAPDAEITEPAADAETTDAEAAEPSAPATESPVEPVPTRTLAELAAGARYSATGKRKTSVARVIIRPGSGQFELNGRSLEVYFPRRVHQAIVRQPLEIVGFAERVDVRARIHGGGISGQADAVRHGIAKALIEADPALRGELKRRQLLTRDPREKERRKAGLKKARKRPQFSKR
jgi:small subunit ribosomal protein S9